MFWIAAVQLRTTVSGTALCAIDAKNARVQIASRSATAFSF
jgi:hypothetical protein